MSTLNILFEGWRFIPHGRGLAGQGLALGLVGRPAVRLFHKDLPWRGASELMAGGIHAPPSELHLRQLLVPSSAHPPDIVVRTGWGDEAFERVAAPALVLAPALRANNTAAQQATLRSALAVTNRGIALWAPSTWVRNELLQAGVAPQDIVALPFGVDPKVFGPASTPMRAFWRRRFGFDGFTFLHVGSMGAHAGLPQVVTAFARVARRHRDARLVLKSVDRLHEGPRALAAALAFLTASDLRNVIDRISYMGEAVSLVEMAGLYQASDIYVAGHGTSFGRPTLEAMACGTPVICSEGGPSDDFADGKVVVRVAADGTRLCGLALEAAMERLMLCPELQRQLAIESPAFVHQAWTWAHAAERLLSFMPGAPTRLV